MKSKTEYILVNMITDTGTVTKTRQKIKYKKNITSGGNVCAGN